MSRRILLNLLLSGLILLLALLVWWLQPIPLPPLTPLLPEQIDRIHISDTTGREIRLHRQAGEWRLKQAPANAQRIEQLLGICTTPSLRRFPAPLERLEEFGLTPPAIRLRLNDLELGFGNTDPLNGWRYVRLGDSIHLIGDGFQHHLTAPASTYQQEE
ncbi:MAG: hypothetical protein ABFR65_10690 [Pseudomonadota bacterium]